MPASDDSSDDPLSTLSEGKLPPPHFPLGRCEKIKIEWEVHSKPRDGPLGKTLERNHILQDCGTEICLTSNPYHPKEVKEIKKSRNSKVLESGPSSGCKAPRNNFFTLSKEKRGLLGKRRDLMV